MRSRQGQLGVDMLFIVRGGLVRLTDAAVRRYVAPHLRQPAARAALASILERADDVRLVKIPGELEAQEELTAQIIRAGGPPEPRQASE